MGQYDQHGSGGGKRSDHDDVEAVKNQARAEIGEATSKAKQALGEAKDSATKAYDDIRSQARGVYRDAKGKAAELRRHTPNSPEAARQTIGRFVATNPAMVAVVGLAAGLIVGALLPGTRREDEMFGRYADDAKDQGLRYARDLVEQGRHYVEDSFEQAREAARDQA